jgi:hypothetical protein
VASTTLAPSEDIIPVTETYGTTVYRATGFNKENVPAVYDLLEGEFKKHNC